MELRKLKQLIQLVEHSGITELEITTGSDQVRIARSNPPVTLQHYTLSSPPASSAPATPASNTTGTDNSKIQKSPMVGTLHLSPKPDAQPFVSIGQQINAGDTLCLIEAMKLMNEIDAERSGTITAILANHSQAVEYGEPLFVIE